MEGIDFKEKGLVLLDGKEISYSIGTACEVTFDFIEIWDKIKELDMNEHILVFLHTHCPGTSPRCSETDINCMKGLYRSLKVPILFTICSFTDNIVFDEETVNVCTYRYDETGLSSLPGLRDINVLNFATKLYSDLDGL